VRSLRASLCVRAGLCCWQLEGCAELYGLDHQETKTSARNLRQLLVDSGAADEAKKLGEKYGLEVDVS
jgi:hypothetical protein